MMLRSVLCVFGVGLAGHALAESPNVAADIAPVHSLVARVMVGVGEPALIVPPFASPHDHAMRPSEARALQSADIVFWVGEELTPWMAKPLSALSENAQQIALLDADGSVLLEFRDPAENHDNHHEGHDESEDHADEHDDYGHDEGVADTHDENGHGHDHAGIDPHAWLDPENARIWVQVIAETLADADPGNAQKYRDNAQMADTELTALQARIAEDLDEMQARRFITFHDAYQYFEKRFGLHTSGTVSLSDAAAPGPARLAALRDKILVDGVECAFAEPQFDTRLVRTAIEGSSAEILELDPMGVGLTPGAELYPELLSAMTKSYEACAGQQ